MADSWFSILTNIAIMFMVILAGWLARKKNFLSAESTGTLSRFLVDLTMPAMVFASMLKSITPEKLLASWYIPVMGIAVICIALLVGMATTPFFTKRGQRSTYIYIIGFSNWIYLPLPIVNALFGDDGVRIVLLSNIGAQLAVWTIGIWIIKRSKPDWGSLRNLLVNPGLIATAAGIVIALLIPASRALESALLTTTTHPFALISALVVRAMSMVGSLTIPLSLVVIGAQLGGLDISDHRPSLPLTGAVLSRLLLAPAVCILLIYFFSTALGGVFDETTRRVMYIVVAMPVAVNCGIMAERFGGDVSLAARTIFTTTLLSIATVPAIYYLAQRMGL